LTDNVVMFNGVTSLDMNPELVLKAAAERKLDSVVVMGYDPDGTMYFASSIANGPDVLWLMEVMKQELLNASVPE